jgi:phosphate transport system substrate-binding protein
MQYFFKVRTFLVSFILCVIFSPFAFCEPIAVVVNKANTVDELSLSKLKRIYEAKMEVWPDGTEIIPLNRESIAPVRITFSKIVHGKEPIKMKGYWYAQRFKGIRPPMVQTSSHLLKKTVASVKGAIGYMYLSEVDNTVKVLKVDALMPGEVGYKLEELEQ